MDPIITNSLMTFGAGFTGAMFAKAQGPGQALDDIMTIVGFEKLHEIAEKKRVKRDTNIQQYKDSIAQNIVKIPEENIQEPPLSIVGPALEASKYYIEEEEIREMFSNLISSSMDNRDSSIIHSSFVEIIKQLSPLDAKNLTYLSNGQSEIGKIRLYKKSGGYTEPSENIYVGNPEEKNIDLISPSLINLQRLGLISISYDTFNYLDSSYDKIRQSDEYLLYKSIIDNINIVKNNIAEGLIKENDVKNLENHLDFERMALVKGIVSITSYGKNFVKICLQN